MHAIKIGVPYLFDRPIPINRNSYLAARLGGIKQKKSSWGSITNNTFLLFYSPNPRSQLWILIYRKWSIRRRPLLNAADGIACVAWRFWLGALSNKGRRGQRNHEEIFLAALPSVLARFASEFRSFPTRAPGSTKPPCYAGYWWKQN